MKENPRNHPDVCPVPDPSYAANTYRKTITVTSGVNVEFNNEAIDTTDANGKAVEAFIYNGTTYIADSCGVE